MRKKFDITLGHHESGKARYSTAEAFGLCGQGKYVQGAIDDLLSRLVELADLFGMSVVEMRYDLRDTCHANTAHGILDFEPHYDAYERIARPRAAIKLPRAA